MDIFKNYVEYLKDNPEKYWFKRKLYGWGWTPARWQGWLILLVWVVLVLSSVNTLDHEWLKNVIMVIILTGVMLFICYKTGEKPKWQWGQKKEDL